MYQTVSNSQLRVMGACREYIQGPGALNELPQLAIRYGEGHLFAVIDAFLMDSVGKQLEAVFAKSEARISLSVFGGECTISEGKRLAKGVGAADIVAGIGGGKCLDVGKYVGLSRNLPVFSVPTIASNDAATSRLIVLYNDDHMVTSTKFLPFNPDVVLVDTDVIARAPVRFLRAGIGDALTKYFEARSVAAGLGGNNFSARPPFICEKMGKICLETIEASGAECLKALEEGTCHPDFEELVEALVLLSGITFESGGLSIAHSMVRGLTRIPQIAAHLHGEQVAYGVLVQLLIEADMDQFFRIRELNQRLNLPCSLKAFKLTENNLDQAMEEIAAGTVTAPYLANFPIHVSSSDLVRAMRKLEDI